jgi:hypothetical protein
MNQPIDLRELLRETRDAAKDCSFIIAAWLSNPRERPDLESSARIALKRWLELEPKLSDAALAQPPDAKPIGLPVFPFAEGEIPRNHQEKLLMWRDDCVSYWKQRYLSAAAPQPPAGKGEPAARGRIRAWIRGVIQPSTPHSPAEYNEECVPGEDQPEGKGWMPLYFVSPDVIPRKIHERLLLVCWQRLREGSTISEAVSFEAWKKLIAEQAEWPDFKRMASEHEQGG